MLPGTILTVALTLGLCQGQEPVIDLSPWHSAVKKGDIREVQRLLANGADVNARITANPREQFSRPSPFVKGATALHIAAAHGSPELLDILLKAGADLKVEDDFLAKPLFYAAQRGDSAILERFLKAGAKINDPVDHWTGPAVAVAAASGKFDAVKWLVKQGADVQAGIMPALFSAVQGHHFEIAAWLLNNGADLKQRINPSNSKDSLLGVCLASRDTEAVTWLLKHGDDPLYPTDYKGTLPWDQALWLYRYQASSGDDKGRAQGLAIVETFIEECTPEQLGRMNALTDAINFDLDKAVKRLLERGVPVEAKDKEGRTAVHTAVLAGKPAVIELLAKQKADVNAADKRGLTPLHLAAYQACLRIVHESGRIGVDMPGFDMVGKPGKLAGRKPIDFAKGKQPEAADQVLRLLVKLGADPQRATPDGITPLHLAAMIEDPAKTLVFTGLDRVRGGGVLIGNASWWATYHDFDALGTVDLLLELGAKVDVAMKRSLTPLDVAATPAVGRRLRKAGAKSGLTGLAALVATDDLQGLRKDAGKDDANDPGLGGLTPLTWALLLRQYDMVPLLLKRGTDPSRRDARGLSPFWLALADDRQDVLAQLLAAGASADTPLGADEIAVAAVRLNHYSPKAGLKPLALAVVGHYRHADQQWCNGPDPRLLRLLLAFDADPNVKLDQSGWTPLHYAAASNHLEAVQLLLSHDASRTAKNQEGQTPFEVLPKEATGDIREMLRVRP